MRTLSSSAPLKALDLAKILSEPPEPIPWVIEPWLARGNVVCFAGEAKTGKTWTIQDLVISLATGTPFLGCLPVRGGPYRVMYLDEENAERLIKIRLRKLLTGRDLNPNEFPISNLRYFCDNSLNLDDPSRYEASRDAVLDFRPDFIIFDSLVRFHRRNENDNAEMSGFFCDRIKPLARECGSGVILVHHLSKPAPGQSSHDLTHRVRGASDIVGEPDQVWALERDSGGHLLLHHRESRWSETALVLTVSLEDVCEGAGVRLAAYEDLEGAEAIIRAALSEAGSGGMLRKDLIARLSAAGRDAAKRSASKFLGRLHERGVVRKQSDGREARYWLREHAPPDAE